jgi:Rad3-related DNA helicase
LDGLSQVDSAPCLFAPKIKEECWSANKCTYYNARNNALLSRHSALNYKMFLHLPKHLKRKNYIVCDEASELENELVKVFSINIDTYRLQKLGVKIPRLFKFDKITVKDWLSNTTSYIGDYIDSLIKNYNKNPNLVLGEKNKISHLRNLCWQINQCLTEWDSLDWVVDSPDKNTVTVTPLKVNTLTKHIFNYADQIVLMSATIIDHKKFASNLGINKYEYIEANSSFDPQHSPIYVSNTNSLNYTNRDKVLPKIAKQISEICDFFKNEKGIVHTHSKDITDTIKKYLKSDRFLFRDDFYDNETILNKHYSSKEPTVLVSPSLTHGVDLKDDLARFCIIVKLPYLPLGNKRIKKLFEVDKDWYENQMLNTLVQMCGRTTRSKKDYSTTYILDGNGFKILPKAKKKLPDHFFLRIN